MTVPHTSFRILNTEPGRLSPEDRLILRKLALVDEVEADRRYLLENAHKYNCLFIGLRNIIDKDVLASAGQLKCIVTPTTGLNHVDMGGAVERGVTVLSLRGETEFLSTISATAELAWGMLLALIRNIPAAHQSVMSGKWERNQYYGNELRGRTLGILGFGRLGKMLKIYGQAFGMKIIAYDISPVSVVDVEFVGLSELLERSDVISVNLALNDETRGTLGRKEFSLIKQGAFLVNTARGEILDEAALLESLKTGQLAGAAIDVMAGETTGNPSWLKESGLYAYARDHCNLLITPHIGGVTYESVEKTNRFIIDKLADYLRNMP
jgi:D-3-phosphoglycerate dehydrogenase